MQAFLKLIRIKNLLIIAAAQLLIKYFLLEPFVVDIMLNGFGFAILVLATLCIAAAGYIINDINDVETDAINKPDRAIVGNTISTKVAYNLFIGLNILGVLLGFYLSHMVGKSGFFAIFVVVSILLYIYATYLKQILVVGNLVVAGLVGFSIIMVGLFDVFPAIDQNNIETQKTFLKLILDYAIFAFLLTLVREVAKDIQDVEGDYKTGLNTLPIALGRERATKVLTALTFVPLAAVVYYVFTYLYKHQIAVIYFLIAVVAPLIYATIKSFSAKNKSHFAHISLILKIVMLTGMVSIILYKYILL